MQKYNKTENWTSCELRFINTNSLNYRHKLAAHSNSQSIIFCSALLWTMLSFLFENVLTCRVGRSDGQPPSGGVPREVPVLPWDRSQRQPLRLHHAHCAGPVRGARLLLPAFVGRTLQDHRGRVQGICCWTLVQHEWSLRDDFEFGVVSVYTSKNHEKKFLIFSLSRQLLCVPNSCVTRNAWTPTQPLEVAVGVSGAGEGSRGALVPAWPQPCVRSSLRSLTPEPKRRFRLETTRVLCG